MRLLEYGPLAWLIELDGGSEAVVAWTATITAAGRADVAEIVPGATTVLVSLTEAADRDSVQRWLEALEPEPTGASRTGDVIEIPVTYDGDDLDAVARACDLTAFDVIDRHSGPSYRCAFCGFAPGFAYLSGLDPALELPRRATPRTRVPAGSVAIAAGYSAVYPSASPGGWHLLGHTDVRLWDPTRPRPALIAPGDEVRFVDVARMRPDPTDGTERDRDRRG